MLRFSLFSTFSAEFNKLSAAFIKADYNQPSNMTEIPNISNSFVADGLRISVNIRIVVHAASSMLNELCEIEKSD